MITSPGRGVLKAVNVAAQTFLRTVSRVVGAEVIDDAVAFFQAFEGMEEGFRERADAVVGLLSDDDTRSEEHTSELQSLMRISYAVFCLKKKNKKHEDNKITVE